MGKTLAKCVALVSCLCLTHAASAAPVTWDVDATQSFVRLSLPDQAISVDGIGNVTIRLRDAGSTSAWTDAGGRRAFADGTIATDYVDGSTIEFLDGLHNLFALESTNLRPDPASFNTANTNADNPDGQYSGTTTAPAAFGAKARGTFIITFDAAFLSIRDVLYDLDSGVIALGGGTTIASSSTLFTIDSAVLDVDGLALPLGLGQPIPDLLNEAFPTVGFFANTGGGSVTNIGGLDRKLTLSINIPISIDISGIAITGSVAGQIVAFATIPEASTLALTALGFLAIPIAVRRKMRRQSA